MHRIKVSREEGKTILFSAAAVMVAAQLNVDLFVSGFKISLGAVVLASLSLLLPGAPVMWVTICSAPGVYLLRCGLLWLSSGSLEGMRSFLPETCFYLVYGGALTLLVKKAPFGAARPPWLFLLGAADYLANLTELLLRVGGGALHLQVQTRLLAAAAGRTLLVAAIAAAFGHYGVALLKREDLRRYRRLVFLVSRLKGEVVWMKKNASQIEETMNRSYRLYGLLKDSGASRDLSESALAVAKEIHEVKKEYLLITRGISEALEEELLGEEMPFSQVAELLSGSFFREAAERNAAAVLSIDCPYEFYTTQHYFLLSIFRNLLTNALEASKGEPAQISLTQRDGGERWLFLVSDDCGGIKAQHLKKLFTPGFSTKINFETGEVSRGLGLPLVRDLVEELGGEITVENGDGGARFLVSIPKSGIGGKKHEVLSD